MYNITKIQLEGVHNTRDLGGFKSLDGRKIRYNKLIRSGELYNLSQNDKKTLLNEYNLKTIIDFRTETERNEKPDPILNGVNVILNPILQEKTLGITKENNSQTDSNSILLESIDKSNFDGEKYMMNIYKSIICDEFSLKQYRKFFDILLEMNDGAILWHCSAGKDRVGVGTALLLSALDIPQEVIIQDYLMVNEFTKKQIDSLVNIISHKVTNINDISQIQAIFMVKKSYIQSVFNTIDANFGSMKNFLKIKMNLSSEKINALKERYLE